MNDENTHTSVHDEPSHTKLEYDYIADGIYIGTNQCCKTHFDEVLQKEGITADLSLEDHHIDMPFGVDFYTWIPIENHTAPTQDQLAFAVATLEKLVHLRRRIYVHCKNGHGRAPTIVAAYFIAQGMSVTDAVHLIHEQRPDMHLEEVQRDALNDWMAYVGEHYEPEPSGA